MIYMIYMIQYELSYLYDLYDLDRDLSEVCKLMCRSQHAISTLRSPFLKVRRGDYTAVLLGGGGVLENLQKIPKLFFPNFSFLRGNFKKMLERIFPVFFFLSKGKTLQMFTASAD